MKVGRMPLVDSSTVDAQRRDREDEGKIGESDVLCSAHDNVLQP